MLEETAERRSFALFCLYFLAGRIESGQVTVTELRRFLDTKAGRCDRLDGTPATEVDPLALEALLAISDAFPAPATVPAAYVDFLLKLSRDMAHAVACGWLSPSAISELTNTQIADLRVYQKEETEADALIARATQLPPARYPGLDQLVAKVRNATTDEEHRRAVQVLMGELERIGG